MSQDIREKVKERVEKAITEGSDTKGGSRPIDQMWPWDSMSGGEESTPDPAAQPAGDIASEQRQDGVASDGVEEKMDPKGLRKGAQIIPTSADHPMFL